MYNSNLFCFKIDDRLRFCQKIHTKNQRHVTFKEEKLTQKQKTTKQNLTICNLWRLDNLAICQAYTKHLRTVLHDQTKPLCKLSRHKIARSTTIQQKHMFRATNNALNSNQTWTTLHHLVVQKQKIAQGQFPWPPSSYSPSASPSKCDAPYCYYWRCTS